ncbi:hypothetical protein DFH08DRAFT_930341 [Mycena albidolilacea]|uniref:Uncharacterized protein n=1 Tax=Mycena albidolilacea TaxID=1033008 RepID=A0AAD7F495_9AGAR|nr:hypothetical protein DFH08DRAFT_930341 [Mycena albidolilacea]
MLFNQFRDSSKHHCWSMDTSTEKSLVATICVKLQPIQLCLTTPMKENNFEVKDIAHELSSWHTEPFKDHNPTVDPSAMSNILRSSSLDTILPSMLARHFDWKHFFASLIPIRFQIPTPWMMRNRLFLGSAVINTYNKLHPVAYIPHQSKVQILPWELRVLPGVSCAPHINSVFSRINPYVTGVIDRLRCAVTNDLQCHQPLHDEGTLQEAHMFLRPIIMKQEGQRIGLDFSESDHFYWSLDSTGSSRMTQDECDLIGLPRLQFLFLPTARFWHEYHYNAICKFFEAKGFDAESQDVTRLLGLPLAEVESDIPPIAVPDDKAHL